MRILFAPVLFVLLLFRFRFIIVKDGGGLYSGMVILVNNGFA